MEALPVLTDRELENSKTWFKIFTADAAYDIFKDARRVIFVGRRGRHRCLGYFRPQPLAGPTHPYTARKKFHTYCGVRSSIFFADPGDWTRFILEKPQRAIPAIFIVMVLIGLIALLYRAYKTIGRQLTLVREAAENKALVAQFGAGGRWPHCRRSGGGGAPWENMIKEIERPGNDFWTSLERTVLILSERTSPLYDVLSEYQVWAD